jgi:predicted DNA-binding transcriptional regulator YafY
VAKTTKKQPKGERGRADNVEMMERVRDVVHRASGSDQPTRAELAHDYGITPRAVSNLIEYMKRLDIEVTTQARPRDGKKGYVVNATNFMRQDLSVAEAVASVLLTQSVLDTPLATDAGSTQSGLERIRKSLGESVRGKMEHLSGRFAVRLLRAAKPPRANTFRVVLDGILENRVLTMEYESPYAGVKGGTAKAAAAAAGKARKIETVLIEPYGVFFARRSWYLVARKRSAGEMRLYKLARIKRVEVTSDTFSMPRGWTLDKYLENAWETIHSPQPPVKVVVDLSPKVAGNMVETMWHPSQTFTTLADGTVRFTARVAGLDEITWWVLGIGSNARVVEPKELRERVAAEIRAMHRMLEKDEAAAQ